MSGRDPRASMDCAEAADLVPELALGLLDGGERADVLAHVGDCGRCRADLAGLTQVGENLLLLAPVAEPPAGFESRVLDQLERRSSGPRRRRWWRVRTGLAAAAAIVVLALVGVVLALTGDDDGDGGGEQAGPTTAGEGAVGRVLATADMMNDDGEVVATVDFHGGSDGEPGMLAVDMAAWVAELEERGAPTDGEWWLVLNDRDGGELHRYLLPIRPSVAVTLVHGPEAAEATTAAITNDEGRTLCQGEVEQIPA